MATLIAKNSRWLAWLLLGLYLVLAAAGLAFQVIAGAPLGGIPQPVHLLEALVFTVWVAVGALLAARLPQHPLGWLFCLVPIAFMLDQFAWGYAYYATVSRPGSLPGAEIMIISLYWLSRGTLGQIGLISLFLLFPTGRPLSRRWRLVAWIAIIAVAVKIPVEAINPLPFATFPFPRDLIAVPLSLRPAPPLLHSAASLVTRLCLAAAILSLFIRLRQARGVERQQIKWLVYVAAFIPVGLFFLLRGANPELEAPAWFVPLGTFLAVGVGTGGIAIASAVAILRYRLWDIDIIIRRTLVYGLLTLSLAFVYLTTVVALQQLLLAFTGQQTPVAIVASTLFIAALFSPLRRRIQDFIDRRFYRRKYDAAQTLARFAATARDEVDLERLTAELLRVVDQTMRPRSVTLWLRNDEG